MTYTRDQFIDLLYKCVLYYADAWNIFYCYRKQIEPMPDESCYYLLCQDDFFLREQTVILFVYMQKWDYVIDQPSLKWDFERNVPTVNKRLNLYKDYIKAPWDHLTMMFGGSYRLVRDPNHPDGVKHVHQLSQIVPEFKPEGIQALATDFTIDVPENF